MDRAMTATTDVLVIGSGAAGLAAAIAARRTGAAVEIVEAAPLIGGTTALSGGLVWTPGNRLQAALGIVDGPERAFEYLTSVYGASGEREHWRAYLARISAVTAELEALSDLRFMLSDYPDSFAERPGGMAHGRHLQPRPYRRARLGPWARRIRRPAMPPIVSMDEFYNRGFKLDPVAAAWRNPLLLAGRLATGRVAMGHALVAGLLAGCLRAGIAPRTEWRARELLLRNGRAAGVRGEYRGGESTIEARRGVVLASGGFERNAALLQCFLDLPYEGNLTAPSNRGDGLRMAEAAGAALAKTDHLWWWPVAVTDADTGEAQLVVAERSCPHTIVVNRHGRRFANETAHNFALAMLERQGATGAPANHPAWGVFDARFRARYAVLMSLRPHHPDPPWLTRAETLDALAGRIGVDPAALSATVARFNRHASLGRDPEFGRGESAYDRHAGDAGARHPCLGTIEQPPFFALRIGTSSVGTRGGPRTSPQAEILDGDGRAIPGLYGAGNAIATWLGRELPAAGITLSLALTTGWIAGSNVAAG
jgi:3-oxosteroid 1-dehydrogenase